MHLRLGATRRALLGGVLAGRFGLAAPFLVAGMLIPAMGLLALRSVNRRTIQQALAEAGEDAAGSAPATS